MIIHVPLVFLCYLEGLRRMSDVALFSAGALHAILV
jgi:hypothetical protein